MKVVIITSMVMLKSLTYLFWTERARSINKAYLERRNIRIESPIYLYNINKFYLFMPSIPPSQDSVQIFDIFVNCIHFVEKGIVSGRC